LDHPRKIGLSKVINLPESIVWLCLIKFLTLSLTLITLGLLAIISIVPCFCPENFCLKLGYSLKLKPKKSNPSEIWTILVFEDFNLSPLSSRKLLILLIIYSNSSLELTKITRSSAYITNLTLSGIIFSNSSKQKFIKMGKNPSLWSTCVCF